MHTSNKKRKARNRQGPPRVGIFWVLGRRIFIDATAITEASDYSEFKIHEAGHDAVWEKLQQLNPELRNLEYDEVPRGRVMYDPTNDEYLLLADPCILKRPRIVSTIRTKMNLPRKNTTIDSDPHYRCAKCSKVGVVRVPAE